MKLFVSSLIVIMVGLELGLLGPSDAEGTGDVYTQCTNTIIGCKDGAICNAFNLCVARYVHDDLLEMFRFYIGSFPVPCVVGTLLCKCLVSNPQITDFCVVPVYLQSPGYN